MRIRADDLETGVADALRAAEETVRTHSTPAGRRAQQRMASGVNDFGQMIAGGLCGIGVFYGINGAFLCGEREWFWPGLILLVVSLTATAVLLSAKYLPRKRGVKSAAVAGGEYDTERLSDLLPHAPLSPAEKDYVNALMLLLKSDLPLGESERQSLIGQMRQLMGDYRALKTHSAQMEAAFRGNSSDELAAEYERLGQEISATTDPPTLEALRQTRRMVEEQAENQRQSEPTRKRLAAQMQAVEQTVSALRASLARLSAAPAEIAASSLTDMNTLVADVTRQTRSVEQAVEEVAVLGVRG